MTSKALQSTPVSQNTRAYVEYLHPNTEKPAFIMREYGVPSIRTGQYLQKEVLIHDARASGSTFTLDEHGFTLLEQATNVSDFSDENTIAQCYYPEIASLVKSVMGASRIDVVDHTVRHSGRVAGVRQIASHVHNDYTEASCPQKLREHLGEAHANDLLERRVVQVNVWRSINGTVKTAPLAVLDGNTMSPSDLIPCDIVYPDRKGEIYAVAHNPGHRWYYFPHMTSDEVLLFKGYDSERGGCIRFTPHCAFLHPERETGDPPRISIEVRVIASF